MFIKLLSQSPCKRSICFCKKEISKLVLYIPLNETERKTNKKELLEYNQKYLKCYDSYKHRKEN